MVQKLVGVRAAHAVQDLGFYDLWTVMYKRYWYSMWGVQCTSINYHTNVGEESEHLECQDPAKVLLRVLALRGRANSLGLR